MSDEQKPLKVLTANDIFAVEDINIVPVEIPEWKGMVYVRAMSALEREQYFKRVRKSVGKGRKRHEQFIHERSTAILVAMTTCDAQGTLIFSLSQVDELSKKSSKAMDRISDVTAKLNGLTEDDEDEDDREDIGIRKNASEGQTANADGLNTD